MAGWWLEKAAAELSQGDIVRGVAVGLLVHPPVHLQKITVKGNQPAWAAGAPSPDRSGVVRFLAEGRECDVLVLSHGCEIDKPDSKKRVLVAPVAPAARLSTSREAVFEQREYALFPLFEVPQLGDSYADLRLIQPIQRQFLCDENRLASMTEDGSVRLQTQLVGFFTRKALA